jgi:hypothetical protein
MIKYLKYNYLFNFLALAQYVVFVKSITNNEITESPLIFADKGAFRINKILSGKQSD